MRTATFVTSSALPSGFSLPRSVAIAAAVTLHLSLAAMLAMPIAAPDAEMPEPTVVRTEVLPPPPPPPIAPPPPRPVVRSITPPRSVPLPTPVAPAPVPEAVIAPTTDMPSLLDTVAPDISGETTDIDSGPAEESLQLRSGTPPRYPPSALSRRLEGEVELLILVGIDGRPESVTITRSSGHGVLDRAAREHVLRRWVFEPSQRNGIAVPAYARVPVRFSLP
ncbi:energy transducer TonB [Silanimonas sp.]|uniref:energy transducer TonB n=1 Tax=Silanimonas sp. TaxID=1929290 RepID=UPI0022C34ACB|nr:energy transducer TonB [Silanimonas sp.]MCZ8061952.1 TonB family protein [Silanimonas sp.]